METVLKNIIMAELFYAYLSPYDSSNEHFIIVPCNMFSINCNGGDLDYSIQSGFVHKSYNFQNVEILFYKPQDTKWEIIYGDTIRAIKDFLYVDKWNDLTIQLYYAGKNQFNPRDRGFQICLQKDDMDIIELSEEEKKDGIIAKIKFKNAFTHE